MNRIPLKYEMIFRFHNDDKQKFEVKIDAVWSSQLPPFNYDVDISKLSIASAVAMEPWSREYFQNLER